MKEKLNYEVYEIKKKAMYTISENNQFHAKDREAEASKEND